MKRLAQLVVLAIVALGIIALPADAMVITTADGNGADTFINGEGTVYHYGDTNFGTDPTMQCRCLGGDYTRKGYVRFDIAGIHAADVTLNMTVSSTIDRTGVDNAMNVWLLNDGYAGVDNSSPANGTVTDDEDTHDEFWAETDPNGIDWFSAPGNLGDTTMDPASTTLLGSFFVAKDAPAHTTYSFNDPDLLAAVQNDTNGVITLAMQPASGDNYVYFYTKEGAATAEQPQLVVPTAALTWDGEGGANKDWSHAANWNPDGLPTDSATFNDTATAAAGTVTNIVDEDFTIGSLTYENTANAHTTQIDAGATLLLNGLGTGRSLVVGNVPSGGADATAVLTGGGSLVVSSPSEDILVTAGSTSSPHSESVLDMSGLANFQATINEFRIATEHVRTQAQVTLANTNTITADAIIVASSTYTGTLDSFLRLGNSNTINTNKIIVAGARSTSTLEFDPTLTGTPTVTIRGKAGGTSRTAMWVADQRGAGGYGTGGSSTAVGTADFTAGSIDAMFSTLIVGRNGYVASLQPGGAQGTFSFDAGTVDAQTLIVGLSPLPYSSNLANYNTPTEGQTIGTLNMGGGTLVASTMLLGETQGVNTPINSYGLDRSTRATGTFNLSGGNATVTGNVTLANHTSTGTALATGIINMTGGSLDVQGNLVEGAGGAISLSTVNVLGGALTVDGDLKVDSLRVGINHASGTATVGGDVVVGASGTLDIGVRDDGVSGPVVVGTLDLTNANSVTLDLDNLRLGVNNRAKARGNILLSTATNTITATTIVLGDSTSSYQDVAGDESRIELNGTTTIAADNIRVGMLRSRGIIEFGTGGGSLTLGSAGDPIAQVRVGYNGGGTSSFAYGELDFSGGTVDAWVDEVVLGNHGGPYTTGTGGGTGILSIAAGTLRANSIILGNATMGGYGPGNATGTINFSGGTLIAGSIAQGSTAGNSTATFNWTGGTLHVDSFGFDLVQDGGTLAPGRSPGQTDVSGNYLLNAGILEIEINGTDQGDQIPAPPNDDDIGYDFVNVSGTATLDSTLAAVLLDGYTPGAGVFFDVLTAEAITLGANFALDQANAALPGPNEFEYSIIQGGNGQILRLQVVPEPATLTLLGLGLAAIARRRRSVAR